MKDTDVSRIALRRVFDIALLEFGSKGYELTSLDEIAKRAGVDREFVRDSFPSKYDLFVDTLRDVCSHYLLGEKNYTSVENFFVRSVKRIKEMSEHAQPILDFLIAFSYTMNFFPKDVLKRVKVFLEQTDAYKILSQSFKERGIIEDPFTVIAAFIRASSAMTKIYMNSGLGLPDDDVYLQPFKEYYTANEKQDNSVLRSIGAKNIAEEVLEDDDSIGNHAIEMGQGFAPRMYADEKCLKILGFENDDLTPEKLYRAWFERIDPDALDEMMIHIDKLIKGEAVYRLEYPWKRKDGSTAYFRAAAKSIAEKDNYYRMEGILKDVTSEFLNKEEAKKGRILEDIASALGRQIEIIFYVNPNNNEYLIYKPAKGLEHFELEFNVNDFFGEAIIRAKKFIHPEDTLAFTQFLNKKNLENKLKEKDSLVFSFRLLINGMITHTRMVVSSSIDKLHWIMSVENTEHDFEVQEFTKVKTNAILTNLTSSYDFITYVRMDVNEEPTKAKDSPYIISETFAKIMPSLAKTKYFKDKLDEITLSIVSPKEQSTFRKSVSFNDVIDSLSYDSEYTVPFRAVINGEELFYQMKFTADKKGNDVIGIIASIGSIDKDIKIKNKVEELEVEQRRIQSFNKLFADIYYSAYLLDLDENAFAIYKRHNEYADGFIELENFDDYFEDFIEEEVFEPDREMMLEVCKTEYIKQKLRETDEFQIKYRDISMGSVLWFKLVVVKGENENSAAIGVVNIDREVKKTQNEQKHLEELVEERTKELNKSNEELEAVNEGIFEALAETVEGRDKTSGEHVKRVAMFTRILTKEVKKQCPEYNLTDDDVETFALASKLHDLGKIAITDAILLKPGKLTNEEFEIMKSHTVEGAKLLEKLTDIWDDDYLKTAIDICEYHHEKWDGRGYPRGLKGDQIPISAQIVSIADCFDALTSQRPYKEAYTNEEAFDMILNGECGAYSEKLIYCFEAVKTKFFDCKQNMGKYMTTSEKKKVTSKTSSKTEENKTIDPNNGLTYEELERILKELPSNIFFKDTKGRYVFCSQIWKQIKTDGSENFSIRGKTDLEVRIDRDNAKKAFNEDRKIVKTGRPSQYVIKANIDPTKPEYIELIKRPVRDKNGKIIGIVGQINDVTEKIAIEEKLRRVAETDELTGFGNRSKLDEYVKHTLPNVLYPVGVFMADCDRLKHVNDTFGHKAGDRFIKATAGILTTSFPDNSEFFRLGGDEFLIIVPGSDKADCEKYMEEIKAQSNLVIEDTRVSVSVGSSIMEWPDENFEKVTEKADKMMYLEKNVKHAQQAALEKKLASNKNNRKA